MADNVDLAELEMAFAKDPSSDAFLALSQAYLDQGRFMEAMVVCKKGIRSQPESIEGRLLLARVYAGQGKVPKAIEEVNALLEKDAKVAEAHFFLGQLHERSGRFEEAIDAFKEALILDRHHAGALEALRAKGIDFNPGPSPEELEAQRQEEEAARQRAEAEAARAAAEAAEAAQAAARQNGAGSGSLQQGSTPPGYSSAGISGFHGIQTPATGPGSIPPTPAPGTSGAFAQVGYFGGYDPLAQQAEHAKKKIGLGFSFGLFAILLFCVAGLILFLRANKAEAEEIAALNKEAQKGFVRETTFGLKNAAQRYQKVLEIDDEHEMAVSRLAWIYQTLRWERGDREVDQLAGEALKRAKKIAPDHPLTVAAEAISLVATGKPQEGLDAVEKLKAEIGEGVPPVLTVAEGKARFALRQMPQVRVLLEGLKKSDKPGPLAWAGETWRRLGDELQSAIMLDTALKYEPDHDAALAQRSLLILETRDLGKVDVVLSDVTHLLDLGKSQVGPLQRGYAILARAEFNRLLEKEEQAKTDFAAAKTALGRDPEMLFYESRWAFAKGDTKAGVEALQASLKEDPLRVRAWQILIQEAAAEKGTRDVAEKAFEDASKLFGDDPLLVEARVELLGRQRRLGDATKYLQELKKANTAPEIDRELGRIQLAERDYKTAVTTLQSAADRSNNSPKLSKASTHTLLGRAYAATDDHEKAIDAYKEAIRTAGSYAPAYYYLGKSLQAQTSDGAAKEAYERAAKLDPTSSLGKAAKRAADGLSK